MEGMWNEYINGSKYGCYNDHVVVMYGDYPNGIPRCEIECMNRANYYMGKNYFCIGGNLDPNAYRHYVQDKLKISEDKLKPNHYADYLAFNILDVLKNVYKIEPKSALKLDTDFYLTSPLILNDVLHSKHNKMGTDVGYLIKYPDVTPPNIHYNPCYSYETIEDTTSKKVTDQMFIKALNDYWIKDHYTATGPTLVNSSKYLAEHQMDNIDQIPAWTVDPTIWDEPGVYRSEHVFSSMGIHLLTSVASSMGFTISNPVYTLGTLTYNLDYKE